MFVTDPPDTMYPLYPFLREIITALDAQSPCTLSFPTGCIPLVFLLQNKKAKVVRSTTWFYAVKLRKRAACAASLRKGYWLRRLVSFHSTYRFLYPLFYAFKQEGEGKRAFLSAIIPCKRNAQGIQR